MNNVKSHSYVCQGGLLSRFAVLTVLTASLLSAAGDDVKVYRVPKESKADPHAGLHGQGGSAPDFPQLKYKTPEGWTPTPGGAMRVASFGITKDGQKADVSVIPLPGGAGGVAANVNRWRGQVGLKELSPDALPKTAEAVTVGDAPAELYDLAGESAAGDAARILGVIFHREGMAWFFKMTGEKKLVGDQKAAFVDFLKSVEFSAGGVPPPVLGGSGGLGALPASHPPIGGEGLPAGHPPVGTEAPAGPISHEGQPTWTVPANWKEVSGGQFLVAKFLITGDANTQAAVNVSQSGGDGGGLAGNVNRWRGQLGLGPLDEGEIAKSGKKIKVTSGEATLVEISGTDGRTGQPAKLIGVMVPQNIQTWFYKLMGDAKAVDANRDAFTKFVSEVKY